MLRIGLTGGIGAGKSTVAKELAALGAVIVDGDKIAREVVEPGTPGLAALVEAFGEGILADDGSPLTLRLHAAWDPDHHAAGALAELARDLRRFVRGRYPQPGARQPAGPGTDGAQRSGSREDSARSG